MSTRPSHTYLSLRRTDGEFWACICIVGAEVRLALELGNVEPQPQLEVPGWVDPFPPPETLYLNAPFEMAATTNPPLRHLQLPLQLLLPTSPGGSV